MECAIVECAKSYSYCNWYGQEDFTWQGIWRASIRGRSRTAATSKMEHFVIIVNGWKPLTIITKSSIVDIAAVLDPPLSIHLFRLCWNDHLVSYYSLIYRYGINTKIFVACNIFLCRILIILYKMLIITAISNETRNELTINKILCQNATIFYRQEIIS